MLVLAREQNQAIYITTRHGELIDVLVDTIVDKRTGQVHIAMTLPAMAMDDRVKLSMPDGTQIEVCLVHVRKSELRLGIEAPSHVRIVRDDAVCTEPRETDSAKLL